MEKAFKRQLKRIADNKDGRCLNHHEVTVIAHGLLSLCLEQTIVTHQEDLELFLRMLCKHHTPHHARCVLAEQCLQFFEEGEIEKKLQSGTVSQNPVTPENF